MIKYFYIAILGFSIFYNLFAQENAIKIKSVSIDGNKSIKIKELMPLLRQRPSNFSFTFKGRPFNNRLLKMDALTLKNYFISKGFLLADVKESASFYNNEADIVFNVNEGKQFLIVGIGINTNLYPKYSSFPSTSLKHITNKNIDNKKLFIMIKKNYEKLLFKANKNSFSELKKFTRKI